MRHPHPTEHTVNGAMPTAHGQSTPAPRVEAVQEIRTGERPAYTGPVLPVAIEGIVPVLLRPAQSWQPTPFPVPVAGAAPPVLIAGRQDLRSRLTVRNTGTATVYLGARVDVTPSSGYALPGGSAVELFTRAEVYAVAATTDPGLVSVVSASGAGSADAHVDLPAGVSISGWEIQYGAVGAGLLAQVTLSGLATANGGSIVYGHRLNTTGAQFSYKYVTPLAPTTNVDLDVPATVTTNWFAQLYGSGGATLAGAVSVSAEYA